jgi:hypothetical protein
MKNLCKALLLTLLLALPISAVERSETFFLLPSSIQQEIIIFEMKKPTKPRWFYITPDFYSIANEYLFEDKTNKYWWNKYRLTIYF